MTVATSTRGGSGGDDRRDLRRHSTASAPLGGVTAARGGALAFVRGLCRILLSAGTRGPAPFVISSLHITRRLRTSCSGSGSIASSKMEGGSYVIHARATPGSGRGRGSRRRRRLRGGRHPGITDRATPGTLGNRRCWPDRRDRAADRAVSPAGGGLRRCRLSRVRDR